MTGVECAACDGEPIAPHHWRWTCIDCGAVVHYRCAPGGVPVTDAARLVCGTCGGRLEVSDGQLDGQGKLL